MINRYTSVVFAIIVLLAWISPSVAQNQVLYYSGPTYVGGTGGGATTTYNAGFGTNSSNELTNGFGIFNGATAADGSNNTTVGQAGDRQTPGGANGAYGILIIVGQAPGPLLAASTPTGLSIDPTLYSALTISFKQGDASSSDAAQLAILAGGQWYTTTMTFATPAETAAQFATNSGSLAVPQSYVFNPAAANFHLLSFNPGTSLAQGGTPATALSGPITGIGFFSPAAPSANIRIANIQITGTPNGSVQTVPDADWNSSFPATPVSSQNYATVPGLDTAAPGPSDPVGVAYSSTIQANHTSGTNTFLGNSLTVVGDTRLLLMQQPGDTASANLILKDQSNTVLVSPTHGTATLAGTIMVPAVSTAYLGVNSSQSILNVTSTLTGSGTLNIGVGGSGLASETVNLTGTVSAFTGTINVYNASSFSLASSMPNGTLVIANTASSVVISNPITVSSLTIGTTSVSGGTYSPAQLNLMAGANTFSGLGTVTVSNLLVSDNREKISVSPSGTYSVSSSVTGWTFSGTLPNPPTQESQSSGTDSIGAYQQLSFSWLDSSARAMTGTIKYYTGQDVVLFSDTLVAASANAPSPFPNFTTLPQGLSKFCYANSAFTPPAFNVQANSSMPWVLFDSSADTVIISPASHFLPSTLLGDGSTQIASGYAGGLANIPAGFTQQTIMSVSKGINHTFNTWGQALTNLYSKTRPANDVDVALRYYGIWTDAGANYYYNYNMNASAPGQSAYGATLGNLVADFTAKLIPVHYLQMDSWWYDKTNVYFNGGNAGGYKPGVPQQAWALYGGGLNWVSDNYLFPTGLQAFSQFLGNQTSSAGSPPAMPLIAHARFDDTSSTLTSTPAPSVNPTFYAEYGNTYANDFTGVTGISQRYWNDRASYAKASNIQYFEEDWIYDMIAGSPGLVNTTNQGDQFLGNMAASMAAQGIDIQYCQTSPTSILEASEFGNVTSMRVSNDGFNSGAYHDFLYGCRLADSMGIWPWCDVFNSTTLPSLLLSTLSAGPVGTGDAQGNESATNLFMSIRADGVIVKPDLPVTPTDASFVAESAAGQNAGAPLVGSTTTNNGITTTYAVAFAQSNSSTSTATFSMSDLGVTGPAYFYNYFSGTATKVASGGTLSAPLASGGVSYYIIAPVGQSGIAFLGDVGKFVSNGKKRISSVSDQTGALSATVLFAPTESQITLHGYAQVQPYVTVQGGTAAPVSYNSTTGHFTVAVTVSPSTPLNTDTDPARPVTVTFGTASPAIQIPASATPATVSQGATTQLSVLGTDASGESVLTYTWQTTGTPPGTVTFTVNGTNAAKHTAATFSAPGTYNLLVTAADPSGGTVTSSVSVVVTAAVVPNLVSVGSVQNHAGTPYSIPLPLTGAEGVEGRNVNTSLQLVFTFDQSMTSGTAEVNSNINVSSVTCSGNTMIVNLTGVADAQNVTVTVSDLNGTSGSAAITFGVLAGDVNNDGVVSSQDLVAVRNSVGDQSGVGAFPPANDVNEDGIINSQDLVYVRNRVGNQISP